MKFSEKWVLRYTPSPVDAIQEHPKINFGNIGTLVHPLPRRLFQERPMFVPRIRRFLPGHFGLIFDGRVETCFTPRVYCERRKAFDHFVSRELFFKFRGGPQPLTLPRGLHRYRSDSSHLSHERDRLAVDVLTQASAANSRRFRAHCSSPCRMRVLVQ